MWRESRSLGLSSYFILCCSPQPAQWPWLNSFEDVHVIFVPKAKLNTVSQHTTVRKKSPFSSACWLFFGWYSLGHSSLPAQDPTGDFCPNLVSTRTPTYVLCCKAFCQHSVTPQPAQVHGFVPSQVQDPTFLFAGLSEVPGGLFPQLVKSLWTAVKPPAHSVLPSVGIFHRGACQAVTGAVVKAFDTIHPRNTAGSCPPALTTSQTPAHWPLTSKPRQIFSHLVLHISQVWLQHLSCLWTLVLFCGWGSIAKIRVQRSEAGELSCFPVSAVWPSVSGPSHRDQMIHVI